MQFYFIRHAQSSNNALWDATKSSKGRSHDPELSPTGVRQAERLAAAMAHRGPQQPENWRDPQNIHGFWLTHLYSSLMLRAVQTGSIVSEATGLPLDGWIDAHEEGGLFLEDEETGLRHGKPGYTRALFQQHFPRLRVPKGIGENGWWDRPFEEFDARVVRAQRFLQGLLERHGGSDDRVAVISHGGFYNILMHLVLNMPLNRNYWFAMNNTGITRVDFVDERVVVYMNHLRHLPADLIT